MVRACFLNRRRLHWLVRNHEVRLPCEFQVLLLNMFFLSSLLEKIKEILLGISEALEKLVYMSFIASSTSFFQLFLYIFFLIVIIFNHDHNQHHTVTLFKIPQNRLDLQKYIF